MFIPPLRSRIQAQQPTRLLIADDASDYDQPSLNSAMDITCLETPDPLSQRMFPALFDIPVT